MMADNLKLNNLVCLVDENKSQTRSLPTSRIEDKFKAFGWRVITVSDGHNMSEINDALEQSKKEREERKAKIKNDAESDEDSSILDSIGSGLSFVGEQIASFFTSFISGARDLLGDINDVIDDQTFLNKLLANRSKSQIHKILFSLATNFPSPTLSGIGELNVETLPNTTGVSAKSNAASKGSVVQVQESECIRVGFDVSSADDQDLGNYQYYLTFGALLKIIEQTIFQDEAGLPLVSIDWIR